MEEKVFGIGLGLELSTEARDGIQLTEIAQLYRPCVAVAVHVSQTGCSGRAKRHHADT
jgi:hypothetical protein